ncbi:hypothetical protein [Burkholderia anthina]|uniref:hypothetical protein n=1 Tax=Burkholderia anthina TaxID=179879 RepID=UPI001AA09B9B|nr:hypothetical protein [Burkholderia anthina]QTD92410.1 hypothetical protein J4G50_29730 [Burkholderia anthina]
MSTLIAARRMAPCACVAVAVAAHEHASASAGNRAPPVTMTIDDPSVGDAFDLQYGHIAPLLRARVHLDDIFPNPIHSAFPKP